MSAFGYPSVENMEGAYVMRRANGRLIIPHVAFHVRQATRWKMGALVDAMAAFPAPLPEQRWAAASVHRSYKELHDVAQVEVYAVDYVDVFNDLRWEPWLEGWVAEIGYVEPYEQILLGVRLSPVHRDVSQDAPDETSGDGH